MQVENSFSVDVPREAVWKHLLDVPSVAPCVPGAELTEVVSTTEYRGTVTVKVGAVKVAYRGTVVLEEVDEESHRVVLKATGSETRGSGAATGTVTSTLTQDGDGTRVDIVSDIAVSGRVAQFGRNIIQDVSSRLIQDFARCLEETLKSGGAEPEASKSRSSSSTEPAAGTSQPTEEAAGEAGSAPSHPDEASRTTTQPRPSPAADIKLLPIVVDVTRSRLSRGLSRLSKVLDPNKNPRDE